MGWVEMPDDIDFVVIRDEIDAECAALVEIEFAKREHRLAVLRTLRRFIGEG